jgi:hypothetical protein
MKSQVKHVNAIQEKARIGEVHDESEGATGAHWRSVHLQKCAVSVHESRT